MGAWLIFSVELDSDQTTKGGARRARLNPAFSVVFLSRISSCTVV